jgi:hypothetical protein
LRLAVITPSKAQNRRAYNKLIDTAYTHDIEIYNLEQQARRVYSSQLDPATIIGGDTVDDQDPSLIPNVCDTMSH